MASASAGQWKKTEGEKMNLVAHAEREMRLAGLYDKDADYGGMLPDAVMALVKAHAEQGHSGFSHSMVVHIFNKVVNFKTLTPLTSNPDEWEDISECIGKPCWQSKRDPAYFSDDNGKTWYTNDEKGNQNEKTKTT